jgi:hypothetical protein
MTFIEFRKAFYRIDRNIFEIPQNEQMPIQLITTYNTHKRKRLEVNVEPEYSE